MARNNDCFLQLVKVSQNFGGIDVLKSVDLSIIDGEFLTILGASGSGKTTILRLLGGFLQPTAGDIRYRGEVINQVPPFKRPFNTVFQHYALFPNMNVFQNVSFGLKMKKIDKKIIQKKVYEVIAVLGLDKLHSRMPNQLSGGQQQRVALARAIVCEPKGVLLDEPLGALDAELRKQMQGFLKDLQKQIKTTFVFITHDQEEAIVLSDRIAVLNNHQLEQIGTPEEINYSPKTPFIANFFGENNILNGSVKAIEDGALIVETQIGIIRTRKAAHYCIEDEVLVAFRPEDVAIGNQSDALKLWVKKVDFTGSLTRIHLVNRTRELGGIKVQRMSSALDESFTVGKQMVVSISPDVCTVFKKGT